MKTTTDSLKNEYLNWYLGSSEKGKKRYCGSRMSLVPFLLVHFSFLIILLFIILFSIFYAIIIPNQIQGMLSGANQSQQSSGITVQFANVTSITNQTCSILVDVAIPSMSSLGGTASLLGPTSFTFGNPNQFGDGIIQVVVSQDLDITMNQPSRLQFVATMNVNDMKTAADLIGGISGNFKIDMKTAWTIKWIGITWYRKLALTATYDLNDRNSAIAFAETFNPIPSYIRTPNLNQDIQKVYSSKDLINLGPGLPMVKLGNFSLINTTISSISLEAVVSTENFSTMQMNITRASLQLGSKKIPLLSIVVVPKNGIWQMSNQPQSLGYASRVMDIPCIVTFNIFGTSTSLASSFLSIITKLSSNATLMGPIEMVGVDHGHLVGHLTSKLEIDLPPSFVSAALYSILTSIGPLLVGGLF
jgi:hypothetical protein